MTKYCCCLLDSTTKRMENTTTELLALSSGWGVFIGCCPLADAAVASAVIFTIDCVVSMD